MFLINYCFAQSGQGKLTGTRVSRLVKNKNKNKKNKNKIKKTSTRKEKETEEEKEQEQKEKEETTTTIKRNQRMTNLLLYDQPSFLFL